MTSRRSFGLSVALATPFTAGGELDVHELAAHAHRCLERGCDSLTIAGTTGESAALDAPERARMLETLFSAGIDGRELVVGTLSTSTGETVRQAAAALEAGCRGVLMPPPFYFGDVSDDGLYGWFARVFDRLGADARGVILYNIPQLTGVPLSVDLVGRLREGFFDVVAGVKDSSGDWSYTERLLDAHSDMHVLVGDERHLARAIRAGGSGTICGMANIWPGRIRAILDTGADDPVVEALVAALDAHSIVPAIKAALADAVDVPGWARVRSPLVALDDRARAELAMAVAAAQPAAPERT